MTSAEYQAYEKAIRTGNYIKLTRMNFLNPDGSVAFTLDNDEKNRKSGPWLRDGSVICNLQNGERWSASITLDNTDGSYDYNVNRVWFGTEISLEMGVRLPDGTELFFPLGYYRVNNPQEALSGNKRTVTFSLKDKWAGLDGTLNGVLESSYIIGFGNNIFSPIASLLATDRGDGQPYDREAPVFTTFYNGKTQLLPDGSTASITDTPYDLTVDNDNGTVADVVLGLSDMLVALVGYDATGRLRIDPSQNDILDSDKPVAWRFSLDEAQVTELAYESKIADVRNDYIVIGMMADDNTQPAARVQNLDPMSDTNVNLIGRRTERVSKAEFATQRICEDYAAWQLKRAAVLHKAVTVTCNQIFHLAVNELIEIVRTDRNNEVERHLVQSFSIPLSSTQPMTITATSVHDFPTVTVTQWGG